MKAKQAKAAKPRGVTVEDLPDLTGATRTEPDPELHCFECGASYSANKGDYFNMPAGRIFTCCNEPMSLVRRRVVFELVTSKSV